MEPQRDGQRTGRRISRRQLVTHASTAVIGASAAVIGASAAVIGASWRDRRESRESQESPPGATPQVTPTASLGAIPEATPGAGSRLQVSPPAVRFDERFDIHVTRVERGQPVTITSRLGKYGTVWTATATYTPRMPGDAVDFGDVDPASMIPIDGSFQVADPMAFIWAAQAPGPGSPPWYTFPTQGGIETVTITAAIGDVEIGSTTLERSIPAGAEMPVNVDEDGLVGKFFYPAERSSGPSPAVIVIGGEDRGGLTSYGELTASVLASHGYAALNLAYSGTVNLPPQFENIPLEYFGTAIRWLQRHPAVDPERIAIHGTSHGGEGALLIGSYFPEIKAVVSIVGSGYVEAASWDATPAWTWRGEPVPYVPLGGASSPDELARAEIPVERINGPVLLIGADDDEAALAGHGLRSSSAASNVALDRLRKHDHPWPDQLLRYPGAGHSIGVPYQPVASSVGYLMPGGIGGDPHSNAIADANSWPAILAMLDSRLKS